MQTRKTHAHTQANMSIYARIWKSESNTLVEFSFLFTQHASPSLYLPGLNTKGCAAGLLGMGKSYLLRRQSNECDRECELKSALIEFRQIVTNNEQNDQKFKQIMCNSPKLLPPPSLPRSCWRGCSHFFYTWAFWISDFFRSKKRKLKNSVLLYTSIKI